MAGTFRYGEVGNRTAMGNLVNCWSALPRGGRSGLLKRAQSTRGMDWWRHLDRGVVGGYEEWELTLSEDPRRIQGQRKHDRREGEDKLPGAILLAMSCLCPRRSKL